MYNPAFSFKVEKLIRRSDNIRELTKGYILILKNKTKSESHTYIVTEKKLDMIRKYHNHTLHTNPRHHEEEPQSNNNHKTPGRQTK